MAIDIRIVGSANLGQVQRELNKTAAAAHAANNAMVIGDRDEKGRMRGVVQQAQAYRQMAVYQNQIRDNTIAMTKARGDFAVSSMKVSKATDGVVERIQKQQLSFREMRKEMNLLNQTYRDQMRIQSSYIRSWGTSPSGAQNVDFVTPNFDVQGRGWDQLRTKIGFYSEAIKSASTQTINWGKNTQWSGRQLMAGMTYPLLIAAGVMAKTAYDVDKGLTQIVKVYGDAGDAMQETDAQIKKAAMSTASNLTQYGQSVEDTLEIQSQLASTGKTGQELQADTEVVTKARLLGELDIQDAMKATITLQQVYGQSTDELTDSFNFMNKMENETSLTMQDFVEGIPKVSGILKTLGADVKDTGILLTAMKTAGVDAKEGGNAVKSMVFKDIAPSAKAIKVFKEATGESIEAIVDTTKGDPIATLQGIGKALEDLPGEEQVAVIKEVFGIHQGSKALGIIDALTSKTGQMATAFEIAGESNEAYAETAQAELNSLKEANWVRVQHAIQQVRISLAEIGEVILEEVAPILEWFAEKMGGFSGWFTGLDSGTKKVMLFVGAITMLAGPVIMMLGLFANLTGSAIKGANALVGLFGKGDLMTSKQKAAQLATEAQTQAINRQAAAVNNLSRAFQTQLYAEEKVIRSSMKMADPNSAVGKAWTREAGNIATNTIPSAVVAGNSRGGLYASSGGAKESANAWNNAAQKSKMVEDSSEGTKRSWRSIATSSGSMLVAASTVGMMVTDSGSLMNNLSNAVFLGSLLGPSIVSGLQRSGAMAKIAQFGTNLKASAVSGVTGFVDRNPKVAGAMTGVTKGAGAAKSAIVSVGTAIAGMAGPIGIATIAAGGLYYMISKRAKDAKAQQDALNNSADTFGKIVGANLDVEQEAASKKKKNALDYETLAQKALDADADLRKGIEKMREKYKGGEVSEEDALAYAVKQVGNEMRARGATAQEAAEGARVAAVAINNELASKIKYKIDADMFINIDNIKIGEIDRVRAEMQRIVKEEAELDGWFDLGKEGVTIRAQDGFYKATLSDNLTAGLKDEVKASYAEIQRAEGYERQKFFNKAASDSFSGMEDYYKSLTDKQKKVLKKEGVQSGRELTMWMQNNGGPMGLDTLLEEGGAGLNEKSQKALAEQYEVLRQVLISYLMKAKKMTKEEAQKELGDGLDFNMFAEHFDVKPLQASYNTRQRMMKGYNNQIRIAEMSGKKLSNIQKLQMLNQVREAAGLKKTNNLRDGMSQKVTKNTHELASEERQMKKSTKEIENQEKALKKTNTARRDIFAGDINSSQWVKLQYDPNDATQVQEAAAKYTESYKSIMQGAQDDLLSQVQENAEKIHEGRMDRIEKDAEARTARLDAEQERKEAEFDARQEANDKAFEKRQEAMDKAFERRQEKFDSKWERTMEMFEEKWEQKSDAFAKKWDATMERFDKRAEQAKKTVEDQYDARINKIDETIKKEQEAEEIRQRIFEKEKARIQHLADMANRTIDINMEINSGNLDEAAKLSNDAQAAIELYETDDAGQSSQSASDKRIETLEARKEALGKQKDVAIQRIENRMAAERKALEEQRKIAEKAFEVAKRREQKILEAQRDRERKSLEAQRDRERKSLESQREATRKALERERLIYNKGLEARRKADARATESKRETEQKRYEAAKRSAEKELAVLKAFTPRNRKELNQHIKKLEKAYGEYGVRLEGKGSEWGQAVAGSLAYRTRLAKAEMQNDINWDQFGKVVASRMTKGAFDMSMSEFMKWVGGGATPKSSKSSKKSGKQSTSSTKEGRGLKGLGTSGYRHTGGVIDGSKGSRAGYSGSNLSQSEINITALKGESVLNRRATRALGKSGVDALNRGKVTPEHKERRIPGTNEMGDAPSTLVLADSWVGLLPRWSRYP